MDGENRAAARDDVQALRIAVHESDLSGLIQILGGVRWDVLLLAGDALVTAAADGVAGAEELAGVWVDALRERGWAGDEELAAEMDAAVGRRAVTPPSFSGYRVALKRPETAP